MSRPKPLFNATMRRPAGIMVADAPQGRAVGVLNHVDGLDHPPQPRGEPDADDARQPGLVAPEELVER